MASSSRSLAFRWGFWLVHFSRRLSSLRTCSGWKRILKCRLDQLSGPCGGPQLGPPAVGLGPLSEQALKLRKLPGVETRFGAGVRLGGERPDRPSGELDPGIDRGPPTSEEAGDVVGRLALVDEFEGPEAAALEFFGGPDRSHTIGTSGTVDLFGWPGWSQ